MTGSFLPRPSPDRDAFECDANGHLRGQHVRSLLNHADQGGHGEGGKGGGSVYICMGRAQRTRGKIQDSLYQINTYHTHARQTQGSLLHL